MVAPTAPFDVACTGLDRIERIGHGDRTNDVQQRGSAWIDIDGIDAGHDDGHRTGWRKFRDADDDDGYAG